MYCICILIKRIISVCFTHLIIKICGSYLRKWKIENRTACIGSDRIRLDWIGIGAKILECKLSNGFSNKRDQIPNHKLATLPKSQRIYFTAIGVQLTSVTWKMDSTARTHTIDLCAFMLCVFVFVFVFLCVCVCVWIEYVRNRWVNRNEMVLCVVLNWTARIL